MQFAFRVLFIMKPNNIMVEERGFHYNAVVIDLGKACPLHKEKFYKLSKKVEKQKYLETYPHLAPELVAGDSPQSESTDIYSLGHTINKVLSEKFGESVHHIKEISLSCMSRQPYNRPGLNYFIDTCHEKQHVVCRLQRASYLL